MTTTTTAQKTKEGLATTDAHSCLERFFRTSYHNYSGSTIKNFSTHFSMKFNQLVVALVAYSGRIASTSAADANGYTGTEYTFVGSGYCTPALPSTGHPHYGHISHADQIHTSDPNVCAAHCQSQPNNIEGQIGFDIYYPSNYCYCRYTAGTGSESIYSTAGMDWLTPAAGPVGGADGNGGAKCYRRNGFTSDAYGYIGDEYTFVGNGHCLSAGSTSHYSHPLQADLIQTTNVQVCANHCRSQNNIEGQVGFDLNGSNCYCRYTTGTGVESATSTDGMGSVTPAAGPIAGTDGASSNHRCYRRNAFGQVSIWQIMRESIS